jgi:hypothetical protein
VTTSIEAEGSVKDIAQGFGEQIEAQYSDDDIARLVAQKGFDEAPT